MSDVIPLGRANPANCVFAPVARLEDLSPRPRLNRAALAASLIRNDDAVMAALTIAEDALQPGADEKLRVGALWSIRRVLGLIKEGK